MAGIYPLNGRLQHYVWGGERYIPHLLHIDKTESHYAEYWLGAHPSAPSQVIGTKEEISLDDFLHQNPTALGQQSRQLFGDNLPYLLKVLDVANPLSIQLHPTKEQAKIGFAQENVVGIPLNDPKRTYKDDNHKPEMMIALSDFWLLHGFKTKAQILDTLRQRPSLADLATKLASQDLADFYADIMLATQDQLAQWLLPIIDSQQKAYEQNQLAMQDPDYWMLYTLHAMQISLDKLDAGLMSFYLFNIVNLQVGEGIFQAAGVPHAYLRGQNIELMACSDNVIRGGLTPKHVDIEQLLKIIDCSEIVPQIIAPAPKNQVYTYPTPIADFALSNMPYAKNTEISDRTLNGTILLVMAGEITLEAAQQKLTLKQGQAAFIEADTDYRVHGMQEGYAVLAGLPL
ncbi:mannose-6-phosphate isomerase, class I [Aggregatibacter segnis]|uniref:mannose-6-phosphate isomerase n=1 Tax=Aggregatibacter segnis ATCC 33393 TaxID=888057 RepID=E6KWX2_9PAST|nr:mannose-6-phosphate isomerase, class I [Aggregatibacter segnis]EFU68003.1 mannose-6-phosphate isomerase [Aggregatibacter segnis ATCC 33393]QQB09612.1 mannose-6-phosphate isomerase, class I [Aggregatibacter segnis]SQH64633.1 Mannose-6-phosphate isomerase [Aggregatibacter segnis ATCC 33393]